MARINRTSHGTTGFLTTLVLTCAFAIVASALWTPNGATAVATGESAALPVASLR
jgi:hypothetical protein